MPLFFCFIYSTRCFPAASSDTASCAYPKQLEVEADLPQGESWLTQPLLGSALFWGLCHHFDSFAAFAFCSVLFFHLALW